MRSTNPTAAILSKLRGLDSSYIHLYVDFVQIIMLLQLSFIKRYPNIQLKTFSTDSVYMYVRMGIFFW